MKDFYAKRYQDEMKLAGYTVGDLMVEMFCTHFSECEGNDEYRAILQEKRRDFMKFCAAYAQLKTNKWLGCSNDAPYDIRLFLHLTQDEWQTFIEILPTPLANLARGACKC